MRATPRTGILLCYHLRAPSKLTHSDSNPFNFIEGDLVARPVIELGRPRAFMSGHKLRVFEGAAVFQIGRDAGRTECVASNSNIRADLSWAA